MPKLGIKIDFKNSQSKKRKEEFDKTNYHISTKGNEEKPVWVFEANTDELFLKASLIEEKLAIMEILEHPYGLTATFEISMADVYLDETEGIWPSNISENKRAWIERLIILWLLKSKLQPYMSKVEFSL